MNDFSKLDALKAKLNEYRPLTGPRHHSHKA